jgi:hypothetical protein
VKPEELEVCKNRNRYDDFLETALKFDNLTREEYERFMPNIFEVVPKRKEKEPILMYERIIKELEERWTASEQLPFHGPWHHGLVAGIIIASLKNNDYKFTEADIEEALKRGLMIPAGSCGFHGSCGAGTSLGIATSIITKSTPFHDRERSKALEAASEAIERIGKLGGPRCCRLSTYSTLSLAVKRLADLGYLLPVEETVGRCKVHKLNAQCHGLKCPYYSRPRK